MSLKDSIQRGTKFLRQNPQLIYTLSLSILIPLAFIYTGQNFLSVAEKNQERIEKDRIGLMQDTFVAFAAEFLDDPDFLQERIESLGSQNNSIITFRVLRKTGNSKFIIASLNKNEVGNEDLEYPQEYGLVGLNLEESFILEKFKDGIRHWQAFRAILSNDGNLTGFLMTEISMEHIDSISARNIQIAYIILAAIVAVIVLFILRHARIVDYTALYRRLSELNQLKDEFISIASHELRAPLTLIRGYADELKGDPSDKDKIEIIKNHSDQLAKLVEDILEVSRIESGRLKMENQDIDPADIVENIVSMFQGQAKEKGLTLDLVNKSSGVVTIDPERFRQIITNMVSNSVKYTLQGSVTVDLETTRDELAVSVHDSGIGISGEDQKKLFHKFSRIKDERTSKVRGTGLGLWITKRIVELMNGDIVVESIKGTGSSFIVTFPLKDKQS